MNMPEFLVRNRREPATPPLPVVIPDAELPEVKAFVAASARQREDLAFWKSEAEQVGRDLRLANERIVRLTAELNEVKHERDWLRLHDNSMINSLDDIEALIARAKSKARAEAYAPPGSGQQDITQQGDDLAAGVSELAAKLAPAGDQPNA